jgi:acetyl esterase/lipase
LVREEHDVTYGRGGNEDLKLDLYAPAHLPGPYPAMVFIHGGGWCFGAKEDFRDKARVFAEHGYMAISVNYRLAPQHPFPAQLEDVKCAVRWLRANAGRYQVDSERIGALGASAGGHLALLVGFTEPADGFEGRGGYPEQSSRVRVVINMAGPTDLAWPNWPEMTEKLLAALVGGSRLRMAAAYRTASPASYIRPGGPAVLTIHGTRDVIVPFEQAERLHTALGKAGVLARLESVPDKGHFDWSPDEWQRTDAFAMAFSDRFLKQPTELAGRSP